MGILGVIILSFISYYSLLGTEYITGGKFVDYLKINSETIKTEDSFTFDIMQSDIEKNQLILVGEVHGIGESENFDFNLFKKLYTKHGVRNYLAELDFSQATYMNQYLENEDDSLLHFILKNWVVIQGRNNKTYYEKYKKFHAFYSTLPVDQKFQFIGLDKI